MLISFSTYSQINKQILQLADTSKVFATNKAIGDFIDIKTYPFYIFKLNHAVTSMKTAGFALRSGWLDTIGKTRTVSSDWIKVGNNLSTASNYLVGIGKTPTTKLDVNGDVTVNGTLYIGLKTLTSQKITDYDYLVTRKNDSVELGSVTFLKTDTTRLVLGHVATRFDLKTEAVLTKRNLLKAIGSNIKLTPVVVELGGSGSNYPLSDGVLLYVMALVTDSTYLSSFQYSLGTLGNFIGNNDNSIGIYSTNGTTFTKIGNTPLNSSGSIWKTTPGTTSTVNLVTPLWLVPGKYLIMYLYNADGVATVIPAIYAVGLSYGLQYSTGLPNSTYIIGISSASTYTELPSSINASSFYSTSTGAVIFGL